MDYEIEPLELTDEEIYENIVPKAVDREDLEYDEEADVFIHNSKPYNGWAKTFWEKDKEARKVVDLKWLWSHKDGRIHGLWISFNRNGQREDEQWAEGVNHGLLRVRRKNGMLYQEINLKDGKKNGVRTEWDREGNKKSENMFVDGKLNGLSIQFHDNGQKNCEEVLKDGKEVEGTLKYWNRRGEPVDTADEAEE